MSQPEIDKLKLDVKQLKDDMDVIIKSLAEVTTILENFLHRLERCEKMNTR